MIIKNIFYFIKPLIPRRLQIYLRSKLINRKRLKYTNVWPIDYSSKNPPADWNGWPEQKKFAVVLTHDVESKKGQGRCRLLAELEEKLGFRSSFNFVPERYQNSPALREYLMSRGFEVGVHGLNHDGSLYRTKEIFMNRALKINEYLKNWSAVGFRSPSMHHNLEWLHHLNIKYDASTFDTDPFEPQSDGVRTIFPFWVPNGTLTDGYVELPYTLVQDFTLFILMKESNIKIWTEKVDWIANHGGMVLVNVHPDYISFVEYNNVIDEFPVKLYADLLNYIKEKYNNLYWGALPREIADFWYLNYRDNKISKNISLVHNNMR
jgi:hypothetical protein